MLDGDRAFLPTEAGFALQPAGEAEPAHPGGLRVTLPKLGEHAAVFELEGLRLSVREPGASGEGEISGAAVAYARTGGTSYWTATHDGYEEWLHLAAGVATGRAPVATWEVEGATLRQQGEAVEVMDESGAVRLRVTAPAAWATGGRAVEARLAVQGSTIALWVDAGGEAVLVDPAWTATGSLATARAFQTQTLLANGKVLVAGGVGANRALRAALDAAARRRGDCCSRSVVPVAWRVASRPP